VPCRQPMGGGGARRRDVRFLKRDTTSSPLRRAAAGTTTAKRGDRWPIVETTRDTVFEAVTANRGVSMRPGQPFQARLARSTIRKAKRSAAVDRRGRVKAGFCDEIERYGAATGRCQAA